MKAVAIVGSREKYWEEIKSTGEGRLYVNEYIWKRRHQCKFISGQSPGGGVDLWVERFCIQRVIPFQAFPAKAFTTPEFYARNRTMAEAADVVVAFLAGKMTGGTRYTIDYAIGIGKHTVVYLLKHGVWHREDFNVPATN